MGRGEEALHWGLSSTLLVICKDLTVMVIYERLCGLLYMKHFICFQILNWPSFTEGLRKQIYSYAKVYQTEGGGIHKLIILRGGGGGGKGQILNTNRTATFCFICFLALKSSPEICKDTQKTVRCVTNCVIVKS